MEAQSSHTAAPSADRIHRANPLLAGLHLPDTDEEIIRSIANDPFRNQEWLASHQNIRRIESYLRSVVIPTPKTIQVGRMVFDMIRAGYIARDPWDAGIMREFYSAVPSASPIEHTEVSGGVIMGITGTGKSHGIKAALRALPQVVVRESTIPGMKRCSQIVYLYIEMTTATSLEALLLKITTQIDDLLREEGRLIREFETRGRTLDSRISSVERLLRTYFVGILIIDEIQRLNFAVAPARNRQFLMTVMNASIPVLLSGNPLGFEFLEKMEDGEKGKPSQLWRRLTMYGRIRLEPSPEPDDTGPDMELKTLVRGLWRCRLGPAAAFDDSHFRLFWWGSGGFPDFVVRLWAGIQRYWVTAHFQQLDDSIVAHVVNSDSNSLRDMLHFIEAFRNRDVVALRQFSDVDWKHYAELWGASDPIKPNRDSDPGAGTLVHEPPPSEDPVPPRNVIEGRERTIKARGTRARNKAARAKNPNLQEVVEANLKGLADVIAKKGRKDS